MIVPQDVTGLILAGGEGRRMGGADKGLVDYRGRPLIAHVIDALRGQVGRMLISANRNAGAYAAFGWPLAGDSRTGFQGPLAGIEAGLARVETPWVLIVPCDLPGLPSDLLERLSAGLVESAAAAVACSEGRRHAVLLCRQEAGRVAGQLLDADERRFGALVSSLGAVEVMFPAGSAGDSPFANLNTPDALNS